MNRTKAKVALAAALFSLALGAAPANAARVYVRIGPPAVRVEVRGAAPSSRHVWTGGYWRWDGRTHVWVAGSWVVPPRHGAVWVDGHWNGGRRGWYWVPGHWR